MPVSTGVLLINLGTPQALTLRAVRAYLREFLSDPRVILAPKWLRWLLLYGVILPFRPKQTLHAYQAIWTEQGSPLLLHSQALAKCLNDALGLDHNVVLGMRYGQPNIEQAVLQLMEHQVEQIVIIPLFPQFAAASTGSALAKALQVLAKQWVLPKISMINDFYQDAAFIQANVDVIRAYPLDFEPERWIFSYHGLPVSHIEKSEIKPRDCDRSGPCPHIDQQNRYCYRAQCYATSRLLAGALGLATDRYHVTFQSRLGRVPWIKPYTDKVLIELASAGIKNIAIVCPSFVADCLETLEEIGLRAADQWKQLGGEHFALLPSLNSHPSWVKALAHMVQAKGC